MADWTDIPDTTLEPGAPAKGRDARFLRDNPIAIAEGAPGAPRIAGQQGPAVQAAGLFTGNAERDWVLARTASASVGAVGTYAYLSTLVNAGQTLSTGTTRSGSSLNYSATGTNESGGNPSGTWRLMGYMQRTDTAASPTSVWLRIS